MIANKTYNNCIDTLKQLGAEHEQIATTTTGDEFARSNMVKPQIHILRSGAGTREGYVNYYPVA